MSIQRAITKMITINGKHNTAQIFLDEIDNATLKQIINMLNQKAFTDSQIRFMPDCHVGKSSVIGTTMTLENFLIPSLLGSDIGCGVLAVQLKEKRIDLPKFNSVVNNHLTTKDSFKDAGYKRLKCLKQVGIKEELVYSNLGTLGGGNHFISLEQDEDNIYLLIHTGSRLLGNIINDYYKQKAYDLCNKEVPFEFSFFGKNTDAYYDYLHDVKIVSEYATLNRELIKKIILKHAKLHEVDEFDCMHNYIDGNILRKGAISCQEGERVIIPLNMAEGSIIGLGKGNSDWNFSGPHGAGRKYSRKDAKNNISMADYKKSMENIFSTSVNSSTIDEAPQAYKDSELIIDSIKDTVEITNMIIPIYNFKNTNK